MSYWDAFVKFDSVQAAEAVKASRHAQTCDYVPADYDIDTLIKTRLPTIDEGRATSAFTLVGTGVLNGTWVPFKAIVDRMPGFVKFHSCGCAFISLLHTDFLTFSLDSTKAGWRAG